MDLQKNSLIEQLKIWINEIALVIDKDEEIDSKYYAYFLQDSNIVLLLIDIIQEQSEASIDENYSYYTACIFVLDVCVAQLQSASENGNKMADKALNNLMSYLAKAIFNNQHPLSFWLPILNCFYEVHVELSDELKEAYFFLANEESELTPFEEDTHLSSMRELILEMSDLSVFEIAKNFFAQSYAMPKEFFADLILDLYEIEEGHEIALLTLLHPKPEIRDMVVAVMDTLMPTITLSSIALSRLQMIKNWYPEVYQEKFNHWIKLQRKKGVIFHRKPAAKIINIKASEVDGSGAQGVFLHIKLKQKHRLCGLLFKDQIGIKDAWITPVLDPIEVSQYNEDAFDGSLMLREVDLSYLMMMTNHFLAIMLEHGGMPDLHLLEIQEELACQFLPQKLDIDDLLQQIGVQISPFTEERSAKSLNRSKKWLKNRRFTESWFIESAEVDALVNRCSSFVDGIKICKLAEAEEAVLTEDFELHREKWLFHFLWLALWARVATKKNETLWEDCFFIAHAIKSGFLLSSIPIMREIANLSVVNSIETMRERRTYMTPVEAKKSS